MPQLSQAAQGYLDDLSQQPAARAPATLGEIWDSEWKRGGLDTITGVGKPLIDATEDLRTAIATASGKPLEEYAAEQRIPLGAGATIDQRIKALGDLADTLPEQPRKTVDPLRDVRRRAATNAQKIERDAAEVSASTYGIAGTATAWAAGIARQSTDPVNLALMAATAPIGGPLEAGALGAAKFIGGQAAAGAVAQAAVEPYIEPARAELGLDSGFGRAAGNVFEAGVGGAALGTLGVGLHHLFRAAADSYRSARPADGVTAPAAEAPISEPPSPIAGHPNLTAEDFDALALHAERDAVAAAPSGADPVTHAQNVSQADRALESGYPVGLNPDKPASWVIRNKDTREVIMETFDPAKVAALNTAKYEAVPIADYLGQLNKEIAKPAVEPELPLAKPIEPKGPPTELKEPADVIGDPVLAQDADRALAQQPDADLQVHIEQPDGSIKAGSAKSFLQEVADDAKAVKELIDCIGQEPK